MRVVFRVEEDIPGLAEKGDRIVIWLDGREDPVRVIRFRSLDAVRTLNRHAHHLSLGDPSAHRLGLVSVLLRTLPPAPPDPSGPPPLRLVE